MADIVTVQELQDASLDVKTLETAINGADTEDVLTRLNKTYPTLAKAIKLIMQKAPINSTPFATKTALLADTTLADNAFAFVHNDDNAEHNGVYQNINGTWTYLKGNTNYSYESSGKNLFNKSKVIDGYEVYGDGRVIEQPQSVASGFIDVSGLSNVTISGLQNNPEMFRYFAFYDSNKNFIVAYDKTGNTVSLAVPSNAKYLQFSLLQRTATVFDGGGTVQVESGMTATTYEPYEPIITAINGISLKSTTMTSTNSASRAYGAKYLFFGDSITQTSNVDANIFTDTEFRSNWTKFAKDMLQMSSYRNYAKSGASFIEYNGQETWQKISHQVQTAIANAESPDIVVLACGTNDGNINLGDYTTAMSKDIASLSMTNTAEAMRWALYQIRKNFPNATCFYSTQLQRADVETEDRKNANDLMVKLAKRYGFYVIDSMYESGIVKDFEVWNANGRYLSDGLHPNLNGQQVQANYIVSEIVNRLMY